MKLSDWLIAISLVVIGLSCLTMSATTIMNPNSYEAYLSNFFQICMWIGVPALIALILYLIFRRKKGE